MVSQFASTATFVRSSGAVAFCTPGISLVDVGSDTEATLSNPIVHGYFLDRLSDSGSDRGSNVDSVPAATLSNPIVLGCFLDLGSDVDGGGRRSDIDSVPATALGNPIDHGC